MPLPSLKETIAAIATPPGKGAVGIIRLSGEDALKVAAQIWRGKSPLSMTGGQFTHGQIVDLETGELLDDALLLVFRSPNSYTGQDACELQTHGSRAVLRKVLHALLAAGVRAAEPGEFTLRAYLNGRMDLAQAEAVLSLVESESDAARRQALRGLSKELSQRIAGISARLLDLLAHIQALLDYPEEGVEPHAAGHVLRQALDQIDTLLKGAKAGKLISQGARLAIVGAPNAGKSSLLNALLGYERAIVAPVAGTTRDYLEAPLEISGVPLVAVDTAGVRETDDPVERAGVERALAVAREADIVLYLADQSCARTQAPDLPWDRTIKVATKVDLPAEWSDSEFLKVSSRAGTGLGLLQDAIHKHLLGSAPEGEIWITNERHTEALREAKERLLEGLSAPEDLMGLSVQAALEALNRIVGKDVPEEVIARVFRNFCVGK